MAEYETLIQPDELVPHLEAGDWIVVDCRFDLASPGRGRSEYDSGHIRNAVYADLERDLSAAVVPGVTGRHPLPRPEVLAQALSRFGARNTTQVVAYDASGGIYAARLWWMMRWLGHRRVAVLDGGWQRWVELGLDVDANAPWGEPVRFDAAPDRARWLDATEVHAGLNGANLLLDARAPNRFAGIEEPLDSVAGHIPGAVNLPWNGNLGADGRFLPADKLRERFAAVLGGREPSDVVCYCGSGVTAAHNLLAMEIAGLSGARLYAGSWSDWILDPSRPVARGS